MKDIFKTVLAAFLALSMYHAMTYAAQQTIESGPGIYWEATKDKLNLMFNELYAHIINVNNPHSVDETDILPTQFGNSGKFLTSDGTNSSWGTPGFGTTLTDPDTDRLLFWDDSADNYAWLTFGDGLNISGTTISSISIDKTGDSAASVFYLDADAGYTSQIRFRTAGSDRWRIGRNTGAESGSDAGSDFTVTSYDDSGTYIITPLTITRATGDVALGSDLDVTGTAGFSSDLIIDAQADHACTPTSGKGCVWVRTSDGALVYTNPAGTDTALGSGSGSGDVTAAGNNTFTGDNTHSGTEIFTGTVNLPSNLTLPNNSVTDDNLETIDQISVLFDGGGSVITTGTKFYVPVKWAGTITESSLLCDQSTTTTVDIWKDTYANYPPTDADSITASAVPGTTASNKDQDATLTGWTTAITAGDILGFNVDANDNAEVCTLSLKVMR